MYDDENVTYRIGINWKDIVIKVIMLAVFLFLLIWLFPKADLDVLYDKVYTENITAMKDAAKSYYTVDRLPETVGESKSMTLKEMIDNKMIIRFTDKNGDYCDESSSKVEVTKTSDNTYVLKVQLSCGDDSDYILETIGCTSVCENGNCTVATTSNTTSDSKDDTGAIDYNDTTDFDASQDYDKDGNVISKTITYYQQRQAINSTQTTYTCPTGYTKVGTKCTRTTTGATIDATAHYAADQVITTDAKISDGTEKTVYTDYIKTKVDTKYTCPDGYTLNGSYCLKYTNAVAHTGDTTYTCPDGYTLSGTTCTKQYNATYKDGATTYSCPNGGTLSGTKCTLSTNATSKTTYTCPSGYSKNGTSCYKVYNATSKTTYSCPDGYSLSGTTCTKTTQTSYDATASTNYGSWVNQGTKYYTSASKAYTGTTSKLVYVGAISGAVCGSPCNNSGIWYKYTYYTRSTNTTYSCPNGGTLSGSKCYKSSTDTKNATAKTKYSCPDGGTLSGSTCTITASATPKTTYSCPDGYSLSGSTCTKQYNATPSTGKGSYTCPSGGTLSGTKCTLTTNATPHTGDTTYTCPTGYTLEGNKCKLQINATGTDIYSYTCPDGYTKSGDGENTKCSKVVKTEGELYCEDASAVLTGNKCVKTIKGEIDYYTCPSDYTLDGTKCTKSTVEAIDATVSTQTVTSYKYMWSTSQYVSGWEFTGKTKTESSTYTAYQK